MTAKFQKITVLEAPGIVEYFGYYRFFYNHTISGKTLANQDWFAKVPAGLRLDAQEKAKAALALSKETPAFRAKKSQTQETMTTEFELIPNGLHLGSKENGIDLKTKEEILDLTDISQVRVFAHHDTIEVMLEA